MAAQELRWLTYLLTDLGEQPRSPPVLYVDNKAMIALCHEHRTKHIALRYFLARELQQRGQLCLAYMATRANTADVFTKALPSGDHQRFSTVPDDHQTEPLPPLPFCAAAPHAPAATATTPEATAATALCAAPPHTTAAIAAATLAVVAAAATTAASTIITAAAAPAAAATAAAATTATATTAGATAATAATTATTAATTAASATLASTITAAAAATTNAAAAAPVAAATPLTAAAASTNTAAASASFATYRCYYCCSCRCSPSLLAHVVASATAVDLLCAEEAGAASAPSGRLSGRGGRKKGGGGGGGGGNGSSGGGGGCSSGGGRGGGGGGGGGAARGGWGSGGGGGGMGGGRGGVGVGGGSGASHRATARGGGSVAPVPITLADPSSGLVVACSSTVLSCLAAPSGSLTVLHLPLFATNLVSTSVLQDMLVTTTSPGVELEAIYTDTVTSNHLAMFIRRHGSGLYTLHTKSGQVAASCSCQVLKHPSLLWPHHLGHLSLLRLHSMHSRLLVSSLPRSLPTLPRLLAPLCTPYVEIRHHAAPHSSAFPPTNPLQSLHTDVWGPAPISGPHWEHYFLLVVASLRATPPCFTCSTRETSMPF
ncbi:unnamed protein product [Closterium sp. NIES-54]